MTRLLSHRLCTIQSGHDSTSKSDFVAHSVDGSMRLMPGRVKNPLNLRDYPIGVAVGGRGSSRTFPDQELVRAARQGRRLPESLQQPLPCYVSRIGPFQKRRVIASTRNSHSRRLAAVSASPHGRCRVLLLTAPRQPPPRRQPARVWHEDPVFPCPGLESFPP